TVHEQVGIAADRRGEVRIGGERQSEMAEPLRAVARLHLRAEQLLHDLLAPVGIADPLDDAIEGAWLDHLAERELDPEGREIVLQGDQLLAASSGSAI